MDEVFERMLANYDLSTTNSRHNATLEVMQQIILAGMQRGGFFDKAAFYGGTCLRIFHGLQRFSEDMDFTLIKQNSDFDIGTYFPFIIKEFEALRREVTITKKEKKNLGKIESAFLKDNTEIYNINFQTEKSLKIKIEVDINPPSNFSTELKLQLHPFSFMTRCVTLPDLFAGKMHALLFRTWGNRVKGRDWYDFEWFVRNGVPLDFNHLQHRAIEFNGIELKMDDYLKLLNERLSTVDINLVKRDVSPFVRNIDELTIWSNDYFLQLARLIKYL